MANKWTPKKKPLYDPELYLRDKRAAKTQSRKALDIANVPRRGKTMKAPVGKGGR